MRNGEDYLVVTVADNELREQILQLAGVEGMVRVARVVVREGVEGMIVAATRELIFEDDAHCLAAIVVMMRHYGMQENDGVGQEKRGYRGDILHS